MLPKILRGNYTHPKPRINAFLNHVRESSCSTGRKGQWYPNVTIGAENKWTESSHC
jgi:hypothetical protein